MIEPFPISPYRETVFTKIRNYLEVGFLLHFIGVISAVCCFLTINHTIHHIPINRLFTFVFFLWLSSFFFMNALFSQLDAYSRYQNFKQLRDQLFIHGYQQRIVKPLAKSSCQRYSALSAGRKLGLENEIKRLYHAMGYRWYHLLPDFVWNQPEFFFHPLFWKSTFLVKRYQSIYF